MFAWKQQSTCELCDASAGDGEEQLMPLQPLAATHLSCLRLRCQLLSFLQHCAAETRQDRTKTNKQESKLSDRDESCSKLFRQLAVGAMSC